MKISSGTIDFWLQANGSGYSDFQHHHWSIGPSATIDTGNTNILTYTWSLTTWGSDSNGGWSAVYQSKTLTTAQVRISSGLVKLTQTVNFGTNNIYADGTDGHDVSEPAWPTYLAWMPSLSTPCTTSFSRPGAPTTYNLIYGPNTWVPSGQKGPGGSEVLVQMPSSYTLTVPPGVGGEIYTGPNDFYTSHARPAAAIPYGWWAWAINLAP